MSGTNDESYSADDIVAAHPVPTLLVGQHRHIIEANAAAEVLFNLSRTALVGARLNEVLDAPHIDLASIWEGEGKSFAAFDIIARLGRSGEHQIDLLISPAHGSARNRIVAMPHYGGSVSTRGPGNAARSAMGAAAMLAHEIKNPLSGIRGAAQLIEGADAGDTARFAQLICTEVDRIATLIDSMQNFTQDARSALALQNIYPAINQARDVARAGFANEIPILESYDPSLPDAFISHDSLVQVLINLIKNAAEALAGEDQPVIFLSTAFRHGLSYDSGDGRGRVALPLEICVCDNGPGVPVSLLEDMFSPFVTSRDLESDGGGGRGLGLALVDKLMREMGGLVRYQRDNDAGLSFFRLHLPIGHQT